MREITIAIAKKRGRDNEGCRETRSVGRTGSSPASKNSSFGTLQGGLYSGSIELNSKGGELLTGLLFGTVLLELADEIGAPALGLSGKPSEYPLQSHIHGLTAHFVYGFGTGIARRRLRAEL